MILKDYQKIVLGSVNEFLDSLSKAQSDIERIPEDMRAGFEYVPRAYDAADSLYQHFIDRPRTSMGKMYPRVVLKVPTGGGKTLLAVETIRTYQENFAKKRTGLVVWIVHRDQIYRQTLAQLANKSHVYRQMLDQVSGGKTLILEKGQRIRKQDFEENLCVLLLMIQSTSRDSNKIFEDSAGFQDFFPSENMYEEHADLLEKYNNQLDFIEDTLFNRKVVKTSLGNVIRVQNPLMIVDEFHRMFTPKAKETLDKLNPAFILGLSATPPAHMVRGQKVYDCNILATVSGRALNDEEMIKLDLHLIPPTTNADWRDVISGIKSKREELEMVAREYEQNHGSYIRPIALIQVDRTGKDQRGLADFVHAEDVREYLQNECGVAPNCIAVKSASIDEIKEEELMSRSCDIRYIITKDALSEGWDCSFAYVLGIIPNTRTNTGLTQLVGRILRQPFAKKTGIQLLDESYAFYSQGETQQVLSQIKSGFEEEGLGDLISGVSQSGSDGQPVLPPSKVKIKDVIASEFVHSLYLPQWIIKKQKRKLHYEIDIRPEIAWNEIDIPAWIKEVLIPALGTTQTVRELVVNVEGTSKQGQEVENHSESFDTLFISRRVSDVVPNPFLAYDITQKLVASFLKLSDQNTLDANNGFIASEFVKFLKEFKRMQEIDIFNNLVDKKIAVLSVSSDDGVGYSLPRHDWIIDSGFQMSYTKTLYEKIDTASMNPLEQKVASLLDNNPQVLWWARNKVDKRGVWYSIQGWQKDKVRPDFVVARKNDEGKLEIVYIMESKGEHLLGNTDSIYKKALFDKINSEVPNIDKISSVAFELNDNFQFEFIAQKDEARHINTLFNQTLFTNQEK
jgi:type III restriction enzyme